MEPWGRRQMRTSLAAALVLVPLALVLAAPFLDGQQYGGYATAVQTIVVAITLVVALITYRHDSHDRRVDRVLALHRELVTGQVGASRRALLDLVRKNGEPYGARAREEIRAKGLGADRAALLRYFERVEAARERGSLDDTLAAALIGRHAGWWHLALCFEDTPARRPLKNFSEWADDFAQHRPTEDLFKSWGQERSKQFARTHCIPEPQTNIAS
ncbi:hypothetical protein ACWEOW_23325 [Monashia sp. NPDC004114]